MLIKHFEKAKLKQKEMIDLKYDQLYRMNFKIRNPLTWDG